MRKTILAAFLAACIVAVPAFSQDVRNTYVSIAAQLADGILTNAKLANMTNSTLKCRTTAGTGVPEDCTAAQSAAIIGGVGGALKSNVITSTRDLTVATGSVAYTGMGFTPTTCEAWGQTAGTIDYITLNGYSNPSLSLQRSISTFGVATQYTNTSALMAYYDSTGSNLQAFVVTSYDADGLTGTWTKTGTPTGTATFYLRCMR